MKKISLILMAVLVVLPAYGFCGERIYSCFRLSREPVIDGKLEDPAWGNIPGVSGFVKLGYCSLASKQTFLKMGYTADSLYIGAVCEEPEMKKIKAEFKDMGKLYNEDSIEIFLFPEGSKNYYQFIVNAIGSRWNGMRPEGKISLENWQAAAYKGEDYYSIEIKIPFEVFGKVPENKEIWTGNLCRNILTGGDRFTSWAYAESAKGFHDLDNWGKIIFKNKTLSFKDAGKIENAILRSRIEEAITVISSMEGELLEARRKYPSLNKNISDLLKNCEGMKELCASLSSNSISPEEYFLTLRRNKQLMNEVNSVKNKILEESFFD